MDRAAKPPADLSGRCRSVGTDASGARLSTTRRYDLVLHRPDEKPLRQQRDLIRGGDVVRRAGRSTSSATRWC